MPTIFTPIDANDQLIEAVLDGVSYQVQLSWNEEGQLWSMSIFDLNLVTLISGIAIVPMWPLLRYARSPVLPPGEFVVVTGLDRISREAFVAGAATLVYVTRDEIEG